MTKIYWYAPFNNAGELETAVELAKSPSIDLMVQSIAERFGRALDTASPGSVRLHRDLPAPSGEGTTRRSVVDRARTAIDRAVKRHRFVKANHFDLIHLHTYNPVTDWLAIPLLKRLSPIVIQSVHNVRPHDSVFPHRMETILLRQGYGACTAIFVAHPILKSMLVDEMGVFADRIHIVPFALTMPVVPPRTCDPDPPRPVRFLFFGTFRNNKGIEVLVEAIDLLESMSGSVGHDCEFVCAGRGAAVRCGRRGRRRDCWTTDRLRPAGRRRQRRWRVRPCRPRRTRRCRCGFRRPRCRRHRRW